MNGGKDECWRLQISRCKYESKEKSLLSLSLAFLSSRDLPSLQTEKIPFQSDKTPDSIFLGTPSKWDLWNTISSDIPAPFTTAIKLSWPWNFCPLEPTRQQRTYSDRSISVVNWWRLYISCDDLRITYSFQPAMQEDLSFALPWILATKGEESIRDWLCPDTTRHTFGGHITFTSKIIVWEKLLQNVDVNYVSTHPDMMKYAVATSPHLVVTANPASPDPEAISSLRWPSESGWIKSWENWRRKMRSMKTKRLSSAGLKMLKLTRKIEMFLSLVQWLKIYLYLRILDSWMTSFRLNY